MALCVASADLRKESVGHICGDVLYIVVYFHAQPQNLWHGARLKKKKGTQNKVLKNSKTNLFKGI